MSTEIKKTMIGGFVVTALTLCIAAVFVFGSGDFFKKTSSYVLFFDDSIKGLSKGAPVSFKGVGIGVVKDIKLIVDVDKMDSYIPVIIEVTPSSWNVVGTNEFKSEKQRIHDLVNKGLRAKLELQSIVTGKYSIALDFYPKEPANYKGAMPDMLEIPTIRGQLDKLANSLENLPWEKLFNSMKVALEGVDKIINSEETKNLIPTIQQTAEKIGILAQDVDRMVPTYRAMAANADREIARLGGRIEEIVTTDIKPILADIHEAVGRINQGMESAQSLIKKADSTIDKNSPVMIEVSRALKELSLASRSMRVLTDYLERHPEALIKGKGEYRR